MKKLLRELVAQRDLLDMVADLDLVDHVHPFDHAAEDRVLAVEKRRRREVDIELATARLAIGIDLVALARHRKRTAQMLLGRADFSGNVVAGTAHAVALRVAALHHETGLDAMEREVVVEAVLGELLEVGDSLGRDRGVEFDYDNAAI